MNHLERLEKLIQKQHGTILSADLSREKIPRVYLQKMMAQGKIERINRGVYALVDTIDDELYVMQTKYTKLIYSHETALYFHNLSDRTPSEYSATVPSGYKVVGDVANRFKIYYIKKELHELGVETIINTYGNPIRIYNIERTICDLIRSRNRFDVEIFHDALKRFAKIKAVDYSTLMAYARKLRIAAVLKNYLEVLL